MTMHDILFLASFTSSSSFLYSLYQLTFFILLSLLSSFYSPLSAALLPSFYSRTFLHSSLLSSSLPPFLHSPIFLLSHLFVTTSSPLLPTVAFPYANDILCKIEYDAESALPPGTDRVLAVYNITGNTVYCYLHLPYLTV
jgi:hypothetical protein